MRIQQTRIFRRISTALWLVLLLTICAPTVAIGQADDRFKTVRDYLEQSVKNDTVAGGTLLVITKGKSSSRLGLVTQT